MRQIYRTRAHDQAELATALARWETEGGRDPVGWRPPPDTAEVAWVRGLPLLPPGYTRQVAWGFCHPSSGLSYELFRVYRAPVPLHGLGLISQLVEDLSYWLTIFWPSGESGQRPACRWVNYGQARKLAGRSMTFARFSSPLSIPAEIARLMPDSLVPEGPTEAPPFSLVERLAS